jgi:hypothetical protein
MNHLVCSFSCEAHTEIPNFVVAGTLGEHAGSDADSAAKVETVGNDMRPARLIDIVKRYLRGSHSDPPSPVDAIVRLLKARNCTPQRLLHLPEYTTPKRRRRRRRGDAQHG